MTRPPNPSQNDPAYQEVNLGILQSFVNFFGDGAHIIQGRLGDTVRSYQELFDQCVAAGNLSDSETESGSTASSPSVTSTFGTLQPRKRDSVHGMTPQDNSRLIELVEKISHLVLFVREINPESGILLQEDHDSKVLQSKAKSSILELLNGLVPINPRLSKTSQNPEDIKKYGDYARSDLEESKKKKDAIELILPIINDESKWTTNYFKEHENILEALKTVLKGTKAAENSTAKRFGSFFSASFLRKPSQEGELDISSKQTLLQLLLEAKERIKNARISVEVKQTINLNGSEKDIFYFTEDDPALDPVPILDIKDNKIDAKPAKPIFAIQGDNQEFLFYDENTKTFEMDLQKFQTVSGKSKKNVKVLAYERYIEDAEGKIYAENIPRKVTADYDLLTVAVATSPFIDERNNRLISTFTGGQTWWLRDKLKLQDPRKQAIDKMARRIVEGCEEKLNNDIDKGAVSSYQNAILEQLRLSGVSNVNHGPETNNHSPEEFTGVGVRCFVKGKASEPFKSNEELLERINKLREEGYPIPVNPKWPLIMDRESGKLELCSDDNKINWKEIDKVIASITEKQQKEDNQKILQLFLELRELELLPPFKFERANAFLQKESQTKDPNPWTRTRLTLQDLSGEISERCEEIHKIRIAKLKNTLMAQTASYKSRNGGANPIVALPHLNKHFPTSEIAHESRIGCFTNMLTKSSKTKVEGRAP